MTTSEDTSAAAAWPQSGATRHPGAIAAAKRYLDAQSRSSQLLDIPIAAARHIKKNLFQRGPVVARQNAGWTVVVLDLAALENDHAITQPLDLGHVVRRQQNRCVMPGAVIVEMTADP